MWNEADSFTVMLLIMRSQDNIVSTETGLWIG